VRPAIIDQMEGSYTQDRWPDMLANYEGEALWYRGIAYAAAWDWNLGASTGMSNLNFEVIGMDPFTVRDVVLGASPADIIARLLTDPHFGLGFPSAYLGNWTKYRDYCLAFGLFLSPSYTAQEEASSILGKLMKLTNSGLLFSEGVLKIVPFGDTALSKTMAADGYDASYTPNIQPVYELNDDDFIVDGTEDPIIIDRRPVVDSFNHVQVEYLDSDNQFNAEIAEAKDLVAIEYYGLRTMDPLQAHEITLAGAAKIIAQNILQRSLYVRNTYTFKLGWKYCLLEPGDFVTITDPPSGLNHTPVRIISIEEDDTGLLTIEAEDAPPGVSHAEMYPHQEARGFTQDYNTPSGAVNTPVAFEAPWPMTLNGHEVRIAASVGVNSGGCHVWISSDGDSYTRVGIITAPACHGFLTAQMVKFADRSIAGTCSVDLSESGGILTSGSQQDAENKFTLAWVDGEFVAFTTAELQASPFHYQLKGFMRRGLYASRITAHTERSPFVLCDDRLFRYAYDPDLAGKSIHIKLQAFNRYGSGAQDLADVMAYSCNLVGYLPTPINLYRSVAPEGSIVFTWDAGGQMPSYFAGYRLYYAHGTATSISNMSLLAPGFVSSSFKFDGLAAGNYTFAVTAVNSVGRESEPCWLSAYISDPSLPLTWPGGSHTEAWNGTWADLPDRWDLLGPHWDALGPLPVDGGGYTCATIDLGANKWTRPIATASMYAGDLVSVTFQMRTGLHADGGPTGNWRPLGYVAARYVQVKAIISGDGTKVGSITVRCAAVTLSLFTNDLNTSTATNNATFHRHGPGHFSVGSNGDTDSVLLATIDAIQGVGPGFTWEVVSKSDSIPSSGFPAATFKVYNSSGTPTDAIVDVTLKIAQKVL
jgi:hypothetical protein